MRDTSTQRLRSAETPVAAARRRDLTRDLIFEIVPMKTASRARLGVGTSIGYLRKNRAVAASLLRTRSYDPGVLLLSLSKLLATDDVEALHVFTFNQVEATNVWRLTAG